jgi:hypothetical protein
LYLLTAVLLGVVAGSSDIVNTSIGWHLASGRWIAAHSTVPRADPFSFTAQGTPWVDHEWLFQTAISLVETSGGVPLLILFRAVLVAGLAVLLYQFGLRSGLDPPAALVIAALCLYGGRIRFFLRPELATLLIAPTVVWIFLRRDTFGERRLLITTAGLMALGANLHAGVLVVPPLLAGLLAAEWLRSRIAPEAGHPSLRSGAFAVIVASVAPILNPYGWQLYKVPVRIAHLVGLPHIPNPEWISPAPSDVPALYVALAAAVVLLAARERDPVRWLLLAMAGALAVRYVRNVGLFFTLLPIAVAPALATVGFATRPRRPKLATTASLAAVVLIASSIVMSPRYSLSFGLSEEIYPHRACAFMEQHGLDDQIAYNDVRFGGFLIRRWYPPRQVFLDDRNEIHEPLLAEIYSLLQRSDQVGWQNMLERYGATVALVRYHEPFRVISPDGATLGERGFSALWFPSDAWALVYWDDTAMVLVKRSPASAGLIERFEYRLVRPDDLGQLRSRLVAEPRLRGAVAAELSRKLAEQPDNRRALALSEFLLRLDRSRG